MISHSNIIANILQTVTFENIPRKQLGISTQVGLGMVLHYVLREALDLLLLGLLPFGHIYGLTLVTQVAQWRGDAIVVLPRFELASFLAAVQRFRIQHLSVVPPILIQMLSHQETCKNYDLKSIRAVTCGAAPLGVETMEDVKKIYPQWVLAQAYGKSTLPVCAYTRTALTMMIGLTEASPLVTSTSEHDVYPGTSGSLLPGALAKVIDMEGREVTTYETRGELLVQSPSIVIGYLNSEKANAETFVWHDDGRWLRTGDEVVVRKSKNGHEHFAVVDRIKELIKVKVRRSKTPDIGILTDQGYQVAPAELEAHLLAHPYVSDCAVIPVPHPRMDEAPKAFVVRTAEAASLEEDAVRAAVTEHVEKHKAKHKWLAGGVEFIDVVPKSASGKILRRLLRDKEKLAAKARGAKL